MIGSSKIFTVGTIGNYGADGPTGPTGASGIDATGCADLATGATAASISTIAHIKSPFSEYGNFLIEYNDGTTSSFNASVFVGNTLFDASGVTSQTQSGISLLRDIVITGTPGSGSTATFRFKGIGSTLSGLTVSNDDNFIIIDGPVVPYGPSGFSANVPIYFSTQTTLSKISSSAMEFTSDVYSNNYLYVNPQGITLKTNLLTHTLVQNNVESTIRGSSGSILDISKYGIFYINTPNGIMGFTGFSGAAGRTGEIISTTLIIQDDSIWNFPSNIWFRPRENHLSCGENILNLTTENNGLTWEANIFGRGYNTFPGNCFSKQSLGACYSTDGSTCESYVTLEECKSRDGVFCERTICAVNNNVGILGACCINGVCKDGISKYMCEKHGGRHWSKELVSGGCSVITCWDPCIDSPSHCCIGINCLDRYSESECNILEGKFNKEACSSNYNSCIGNEMGACCVFDDVCLQRTFNQCHEIGGIFLGEEEECENINCDCVDPTESFCNNNKVYSGINTCLHTHKISLLGADLDRINGVTGATICLKYNTFDIPDRIMVLRTKDINHQNTPIYRSPPHVGYKADACSLPKNEDYLTYYTANSAHPRYFNQSGPHESAILFEGDSECVATNGDVTQTIRINDTDVEFYDTADPWYNIFRVFVFGGCTASTTTTTNTTSYEFSFTCGECSAALQSTYTPISIYVSIPGVDKSILVIDSAANLSKNGISIIQGVDNDPNPPIPDHRMPCDGHLCVPPNPCISVCEFSPSLCVLVFPSTIPSLDPRKLEEIKAAEAYYKMISGPPYCKSMLLPDLLWPIEIVPNGSTFAPIPYGPLNEPHGPNVCTLGPICGYKCPYGYPGNEHQWKCFNNNLTCWLEFFKNTIPNPPSPATRAWEQRNQICPGFTYPL